jgi:hypothetical protein
MLHRPAYGKAHPENARRTAIEVVSGAAGAAACETANAAPTIFTDRIFAFSAAQFFASVFAKSFAMSHTLRKEIAATR